MKKLLLIATTLSIIASCTKESELEINVGDVAASFESATITRATDGVWTPNDKIGIFAYNEAGAIYNNYENIPYVTISGGSQASFTPTNTIIYYPAGGSTLSFIAYSPYQASADDGLYKVNLSAQSTTAEVALIDLIVANDGVQYSNTNTEASLQLDHKLAKLTMTLKAGDGLDASDLVGAEVKLTNIATEGTYDLKGGSFTPSTANQTITPRTITADSEYEAIIFPYTVSTFSVEFYLPVTGKTYTWADNLTFISGKDHAYTVTIAESKISVSSATLSGWGVNDSEDLVAEKVEFISSTQELKDLATAVNSGTTYEGVTFRLTQSIDLGGVEWTPIGTADNPFKGTFDGNNNSIVGLYINTTLYHQALFGVISGGATIKNITVEGSVTSSDGYCAGIIVAALNETDDEIITIENCVNRATVSVEGDGVAGVVYVVEGAATISNCSNMADLSSGGSFVAGVLGGIDGSSSISITNCYNTGNLSGTNYVGGIVSFSFSDSNSSVTNCYNTGDLSGTTYVGGIVGFSASASDSNSNFSVTNCYNTGSVSGSSNVGGIVGFSFSFSDSNSNSSVTNCYWLSSAFSGEGVGYNQGTTVENVESKSESDMTGGSFASTLGSAFKEDYTAPNQVNNGYPILTWQ